MDYKLLKTAILILIILICGCKKKNKNAGFSGLVFEPNMYSYIADAEVILSGQLVESGTWNTNYTILQRTKTDEEGKFELEIELQRISSYRITVSKDGFFDESYTIDPELINEGKIYDNTYNIFSESSLLLNIKNIYPSDSLDELTYSLNAQTQPYNECCSTSDYTFTGTNIDESVSCKLPGHQTIELDIFVVKNGNTTYQKISKYIAEFETKSIDIFY